MLSITRMGISKLTVLFLTGGLAFSHTGRSQDLVRTTPVLVESDQTGSAYGAPVAFSESRFGTLTNAYVLPAGEVYTSAIYELDAAHYRKVDHNFTNEMEVGLPWRVNVAIENAFETTGGKTQETSFSLEGRYAFAAWDKIPLNPTVFSEYKFGIGHVLVDEGAPTPSRKFGPHGFDQSQELPDSYELRLLLSEEFFGRIEWALNTFLENETSGDRGREWGVAQSILTPVLLPMEELKVGVEMQFRSFSDQSSRGIPYNSFVIGPSFGWQLTRNARLDASPLFGVNHKSPQLQGFVVLSYLFGRSGGKEVEAPTSTRNR